MTDIRTSRQGNKEEKVPSPEGHYRHEPRQHEKDLKKRGGGKGSKLFGDTERKHVLRN